jgi:lysozyme family protein
MSRFETCLEFILAREGGYVNHPADRGGPTNKGITQKTYDDYRTRRSLGRMPVVSISGEEIADIYRTQYWQRAACDNLPEPVDMVIFDAAVNSGPKQAVKWLQRIVGTVQDGAAGPNTLKAVEAYAAQHGAKALAKDVIALREMFYDEIVDRDPSQAVFKRGWDSRMALLRSAVSEVA